METQLKLENPFRVLFEANPLPMWIFDSQTLEFLAVNEAAVLHYGYSREEFSKMKLPDIRPVEDVSYLTKALAKVSRHKGIIDSGEWRHVRRDGSIIYVEVASQPVHYNGHRARLSMLNDITDRKISEAALRSSEARLKEAQHVACLGSWECYGSKGGTLFSDEMYRIFGFSPQGEKMDIHSIINVVHPDDRERMRVLLEGMEKNPLDFDTVFRVVDAGGAVRQVHAQGEVFYDSAGKPFKMTGTAQDITEQMRAEQARLRNAQLEAANRELEAFSYSVSHDLRTPLRSIDAFGRLLVEECGGQLDDTGRGYLDLIQSSTHRMNELIDDLIEFSRVTSTQIDRTEVDLSLLVKSITFELQRLSPNRKVELSIAPHLKAHADARLLRIALENLFGNAWKFTSKIEDARIEFGATLQGDETVYFVRDNGAGFDMEFAPRLFGVFQRLHSERDFSGTGIGLAIVQRIIARHGGRIWAEGEVDKGATFFFTLPNSRKPKG